MLDLRLHDREAGKKQVEVSEDRQQSGCIAVDSDCAGLKFVDECRFLVHDAEHQGASDGDVGTGALSNLVRSRVQSAVR